jgi:hypothetical protein
MKSRALISVDFVADSYVTMARIEQIVKSAAESLMGEISAVLPAGEPISFDTEIKDRRDRGPNRKTRERASSVSMNA